MSDLEIKTGMKVTLYKADIYPTPRPLKSAGRKTGVFYLWGDDVVNNMVRLTTMEENVQKAGCITGWVKISELNKTITVPEVTYKGGFVSGQAVVLENAKFYPNSAIEKESAIRSGTYYIWSKDIVNGRIRITNDPIRAGKTGYITAWIKVSDIK